MGFSPNSGGVSLRTFNRNFEGRSGTRGRAGVSGLPRNRRGLRPDAAYITDPTTIGRSALHVTMPEQFLASNDTAVLPPAPRGQRRTDVEVLRGPNIKEFPKSKPLADSLTAKLVLKVGDNITTDHIMPAGAKILPYRSNIPYLSQVLLRGLRSRPSPERAKAAGRRHCRGRQQLRAGFLPGARGAGAHVLGHPVRHCQVLRQNPRGEPDQRGHSAADLCRPGGLRQAESGRCSDHFGHCQRHGAGQTRGHC